VTDVAGPRLDGAGTPERVWRRSSSLAMLPALDERWPQRAVVVSPHPDDDVLGAGGLLRRLANAGTNLTLIGVTSGEASHPRSMMVTPTGLARRREAESRTAYRRLGIDPHTERLGIPDGQVAGHADVLTGAIAEHLEPGTWCVAPWRADGHPDHDAAGRAAESACAASGSHLVSYLVWTWHWASPDDDRVPWSRAARLVLGPVDQWRKRRAVAAYDSQIRPLSLSPDDAAILPPGELSHHLRRFEVLLW
jgi:LmbE family N-acetylglucosaminyl deacetylase